MFLILVTQCPCSRKLPVPYKPEWSVTSRGTGSSTGISQHAVFTTLLPSKTRPFGSAWLAFFSMIKFILGSLQSHFHWGHTHQTYLMSEPRKKDNVSNSLSARSSSALYLALCSASQTSGYKCPSGGRDAAWPYSRNSGIPLLSCKQLWWTSST